MNNKAKVIAMYLPQYHEIEENNKFWGKGFTDWVSVKKAKPIFKGHHQPKVPYNNNYYDLSEKDNIQNQIELALKNGVHGFGIYHYWFSSDKHILDTPSEIILNNPDLNIPFLLAWDNSSWIRSWSAVSGNAWSPKFDKQSSFGNNQDDGVMIKLDYGERQDWKKHYDYLKRYFHDQRYIKIGNKPIFIIFNCEKIVPEMCGYLNELATKDGFDGIFFIDRKRANLTSKLEHEFLYEPLESGWLKLNKYERRVQKAKDILFHNGLSVYDYDKVWKTIIANAEQNKNPNEFYGGFVKYDDSPRRGSHGRMIDKSSPEKFKKYLSKLLEISARQGKEYVFLTAWNEWGEGAYLEPDTEDGFNYLSALKECVDGGML